MPTAPDIFYDKRPWGEEYWFKGEKPSMTKIIKVKPGESLSLQFHDQRDEYWYIISGDGNAEIGEERLELASGVSCFIPRKMTHRLRGGKESLVLLEMAFGHFDEQDIVRLEDKYGRV